MATITLKTVFDISENMTFDVFGSDQTRYGTLLLNDSQISMFFENGKSKQFKDVDIFQKFVEDNCLYFLRPKKSDERWIPYNPNPRGLNTGDCTIRAYTKAFGISWEDAYEMASEYGKEVGALPDDFRVVAKILKEKNCSCTKLKKNDFKMTVSEFAATHPSGTYLLKIRGHLVACIDGYYYDSWNSGSKKISIIFEK